MADDPSDKDRDAQDDIQHPEPPRQVRDPRSYSATSGYGDEGDQKDKGGDDKKGGDDGDKDKGKKKGFFQRPAVLIGGVVLLVLVIIAAVLFWMHARHFQSTDDAYIDTHIVHVAPQIAGRVSVVYATDNQLVGPASCSSRSTRST